MKKEFLLVLIFLLGITAFFFNPVLKGRYPFPGDLLVGGYPPYNTNSYDGYAPGGVTNKAQGPDVIRQLLPWKKLSVNLWKNGTIPLWNPYSFSGTPLMANFQSGIFYPLNVLFVFLPFLAAWTFYIAAIPLLFAFFTYLFLRELSLSKTACIFAAVSAAFSSYMVVWLEYGNVGHAFLWLPLVLYLTEKLFKNNQLRYMLAIIFAFFLSLLAGYIQGYFYEVVVFAIYFMGKLWLLKKLHLKHIMLFIFMLAAPLLLGLFQLLPTLELFSLSARNNYSLSDIDKLLNPVWYLITILIPDFFGHPASRNMWFYGTYIERVSYFGLIPFVFALFALFQYKKQKEILLFAILFVGSLVLATNLWVTKYVYLLPIPVISTTVPTRILSIFVFSGSILAGFGFDYFLRKESVRLYWKTLIGVCSVIFLSWIFVFVAPKFGFETAEHMLIAKRNLYLPTVLAVGIAGLSVLYLRQLVNTKKIIIAGIFVLTLVDLFYFFDKITPFSPSEYLYPKTAVFSWFKNNASVNRIWGYGSGSIESNLTAFEGLYSPDGYDPLFPREYGELLSSSLDGRLHLTRSDARIQPGYGNDDLRKNTYRQTILDLTGVKYVLDKTDSKDPDYSTFPSNIYTMVWHEGTWSIYENKNALPRIGLFYDYQVTPDYLIVPHIYNFGSSLKETLLLSEPLPSGFDIKKDPSASVQLISYSPNKVVVKTSSKSDSLLFLSDNFYPGWKVTIDGLFGKIYKADYSFRAVPIKSGNHEIIFSYGSDSFQKGLAGSIVSLIMLILAGTWYGKKLRI